MFAIGNDEIDAAKPLGDFILCKQCGERHRVQYGERVLANGTRVPSKSLAFYKCGGKNYLVGIKGKDIRKE